MTSCFAQYGLRRKRFFRALLCGAAAFDTLPVRGIFFYRQETAGFVCSRMAGLSLCLADFFSALSTKRKPGFPLGKPGFLSLSKKKDGRAYARERRYAGSREKQDDARLKGSAPNPRLEAAPPAPPFLTS